MSLQKSIEEQAVQFAQAIIAALRTASIDELVGFTGSRAPRATSGAPVAAPRATRLRGGRLARRSADDIAGALDRIVAVLTAHPEGMRAEAIRAELGLDAKELPRPVAEGLATGRLTKRGQKRATTYSVGSAGGEAKPRAKKGAARKKRAAKRGSK
jgi:hypothetical protein